MKTSDRWDEKKTSGTDGESERVDVFGDENLSDRTSAGDTFECLPDAMTERIANNHGGERSYRVYGYKNENDRDAAPALTFILVLLLTVAMTAGAYAAATELGSHPRETLGHIAAVFMFGSGHSGFDANDAVSADSGKSDELLAGENTKAPKITDNNGLAPNDDVAFTETTIGHENETSPARTESASTHEMSSADTSNILFDDRADSGISPSELVAEFGDEILGRLCGSSVIVVCAHPSECFCDGIAVTQAADALVQALSAVGVDTYVCKGEFDASGRLGSYSRTRAALDAMSAGKNIGLVIDLHAGDEPGMLVGWSAADAFRMNVAFADMINNELGSYAVTIAIDNGSFNQNAPWLSLHAELDSSNTSSRGMRDARILADAVIKIFKKSAPDL